MKYFFISDLHVDFYVPMTQNESALRKYFEIFFERNFLPADACCIAGDIANDSFTYLKFLEFINDKYSKVYACLGNHDIITEIPSSFNEDHKFATSESKIDYIFTEVTKLKNIHLLENSIFDGVAGCLGMCDFKYKHSPNASETLNKMLWATRWFEGRHWNYMKNNTSHLWKHYDKVFRNLSKQRPKIMMSHFLPLEFGMSERYRNDPCSNFFYFHGAPYLESLDEGSIWQAGHTHIAIKRKYTDSKGKQHLLLCNPVGYPDETPYAEYGLNKDDFFIEII